MPPSTTVRSPAVRLALAPVEASVARVRRALTHAGLSADLEHTVSLLAAELVRNSVKHAGLGEKDRIVVLAALSEDFARVEVHDGGPGFDPDVRHGTNGFGLRLVDTLASSWGVERRGGCRVWFEVDRRRRRFAR